MRALAVVLASLASLALGACSKAPPEAEAIRRGQWVREMAMREDAGASWRLMNREEVVFADGWYPQEHHPFGDTRGGAWRWMGVRSKANLATEGLRPRRLVLRGYVLRELLESAPTVTVTIDGVVVGTFVVEHDFAFETIVPVALQRRPWVDLVVHTSAFAMPNGDPRELGVALTELGWDVVDAAAPGK